MPNLNPKAQTVLIHSGIPREEIIQQIAQLYHDGLYAKGCAGSKGVSEYNLSFGKAVLDRDFWRLEHITNGLNKIGLAVFSDVSGIQLPRGQKASRNALREWCGLALIDFNLHEARRLVKVWHDSAERHFKTQMPQIVEMVQDWYNRGFVELVKHDSKYYICDRKRKVSLNLSTRNLQGAQFRPYVEAFLSLQLLRVEKGEIFEPAYVDPTAPAEATPTAAATAPLQAGFVF